MWPSLLANSKNKKATALSLSVAFLFLLLAGSLTSPALAARGHVFSISKTFTPTGAQALKEPAGVAVNEATGNIYVADKGNNRVEAFSEKGEYQFEFNGSGSDPIVEGLGSPMVGEYPGEFSSPEGIAVDNACQLHKPVLTESTVPTCAELDPSNGDVYVLDAGHEAIDKFSATGAYIGRLGGFETEYQRIHGEPESLHGVGVDPRGELWVGTRRGAWKFSDTENNNSDVSANPSFLATTIPGCGNLPGFAVDSEDDLYINSQGPASVAAPFCGSVSKFSSAGNILIGTFDPEGSEWLATELAGNDVYVDNGVAVNRVGPEGFLEGLPIESLALADGAGSGVAVSSASETLYVAESVAGDVEVFVPEPAGPPTVERESASKVTGESATLEASVNARGASTSYDFEYGPCATLTTCESSPYGSTEPTPEGSAGAAFEVVSVPAVNVESLSANTVYHYRLVAHNEANHRLNTAHGEEHTFTTQTTPPFARVGGLPDNREWELVSPPEKHGAEIESIGDEVTIQASAVGSAITYTADAPTESEPQGYSGPVQVFSARGADGWSSLDMTVAHESATHTSIGKGAQYRLFSEDLSHAVVQPFGAFVACRSAAGASQPCLSAEASEQTAFLQSAFSGEDPSRTCIQPTGPELEAGAPGCFTPLVTGEDGNDTASPFQPFGEASKCAPPVPQEPICGPEFLGATPDLRHVVLQSSAALTSTPSGNLYEFSQGQPAAQQLAPVNLLPPSEGGGPQGGYLGGYLDKNTRNAISADGSLVFWSSTAINGQTESPLYVRHIVSGVTGETLRLTAGDGVFQDASSESSVGSPVFYSEGGTLFECAISDVPGELKCPPIEVGTGLEGLVLGSSQDGSWLYFVASSASVEGKAVPGAVSGQPNLYVRHAGTTSLVAVLSKEDFPDWDGGDGSLGDLTAMTARVSPNGQWVTFMSQRELTGYDNRDAVSGKPDEEVFLYHAPHNLGSEQGELICASCNPSGARPVGEEGAQGSPGHGGFVVREAWEGSTWLAAEVPAWTPYRLLGSVYQSRFLSDSGRLFFNAIDPLVAHAVNGTWDVYEFEPPGVGSCSAESAAFSERSGGCVGLISGGSSTRESAFLDASENGNDVFFLTAAKLVPQDTDEAFDVYDAHVCGTPESGACLRPEATQPPACEGEAECRPAPTPQPEVFGAPASATFSGPGNIVPPPAVVKPKPKPTKCKRGFVKKKVKKKETCVKAKPKRRAKKSNRRAK